MRGGGPPVQLECLVIGRALEEMFPTVLQDMSPQAVHPVKIKALFQRVLTARIGIATNHKGWTGRLLNVAPSPTNLLANRGCGLAAYLLP